MGKVLTAIAAMMACVSATVPKPIYPHDESAIVRITCQRANGGGAYGSGFKVGPSSYITAAHVVSGGTCSVDGHTIRITALDVKRDFASFEGPASPVTIKTRCDGFLAGEIYLARGFPGGGFYKIASPWFITGIRDKEMQVAFGDAIPGMSGGPVMDGDGVVAGIVVRHSPARALPLSETGYCKGDAA